MTETSAWYIYVFPFILAIIIELVSPKITARFRRFLDTQMDELDDDQIGTDARREIREFSEYAYEIFQMYTALAVTFVSGVFQITIQQNISLLITILLTLALPFLILFGITRDPMQDPFFFMSFTERYNISPTTILVIIINLIFISVIYLAEL